MNTYRYTFAAECPNNGELVVYRLEIETDRQIYVEHIKTACALHTEGYHEAIAADLHARFGGSLRLKANHHGVEIDTVLHQGATFAIEDQATPEAASQLHRFYGVTTDAELIAVQASHIEKLQAKLPALPSLASQRVREG